MPRKLLGQALSENHVPALDHAIHQTNIWLKKLSEEHHLGERQHTRNALRAVLQSLRDRLTVEQAVHLGAEMPTVVRGPYYEGWHIGSNPTGERDVQAFLDRVAGRLPPKSPRDALGVTKSVFAVLADELDGGMIAKVIGGLPEPLKGLGPSAMAH